MNITDQHLEELYKMLLKSGLDNNNSLIFGVQSKLDFAQLSKRGCSMYSMETFLKRATQLSHFTPNIYKSYFNSEEKTGLYGFTDRNLRQINCFVIDIDNLKYSLQDILLACLDTSIGPPTMVLRTPHGHQVYFILDKPMHISNKRNYHSLHVVKRISDNLKRSLKEVDADRYCNDFCFFRVPKLSNIVWLQMQQTYSPEELINWSLKMDDNLDRELYVVPSKSNYKYLHSEIMQTILSLKDIKGAKGEIGRNNTIFTIALACYADGIAIEEAKKMLSKFNNQLSSPLKQSEVLASIRSAYSGRYAGPTNEYLLAITESHGKYEMSFKKPTKWHKFKKERVQRKYSHFKEWEDDIIQFLNEQAVINSPYIHMTQKELCAVIGCPQSTLNEVIKNSNKIIKTSTGKGRAATTKWSTLKKISLYAKQISKKLQESKNSNAYTNRQYIENKVSEEHREISVKTTVPYTLVTKQKYTNSS